MNTKELQKCFKGVDVPQALLDLLDFQNNVSDFGCYANGFGLRDESDFLGYWSGVRDEALDAMNSRIFGFARANCTGSIYAIWQDGTEKTTDEMPIVVFGDEGGAHVVCKNIYQLFKMLTFDVEIDVSWDEVSFYKPDEDVEYYQCSIDSDKFALWLKNKYDIDVINSNEEIFEIIKHAQSSNGDAFKAWMSEYIEL